MTFRALRWVSFLAWVGLAPFLLLRPIEGLAVVPWLFSLELPRVDLLGHATLFWIGARLAVGALAAPPRTSGRVWAVVAAVAVYSVVLEGLQHYVPGRAVEASDLAANLSGALLVASSLPWLGTRTGSPFWASA